MPGRMQLTKPMKDLLESLNDPIYGGCSGIEIYPKEVATAKALERRGLIEVEGMMARVKLPAT